MAREARLSLVGSLMAQRQKQDVSVTLPHRAIPELSRPLIKKLTRAQLGGGGG